MHLEKAYDAKKFEDSIYKEWENSGSFKPKIVKGKKPFTIMMPPPNATGTLHLGHAVMLALEDIMTRYHRMKGDPTLWVPGTDHASIATQNKVEKILAEKGVTRHQLGRVAFLKEFETSSKNGFSVSKGIIFLFTVIPALSRTSATIFPVQAFGLRSTSKR